MKKSTYRTLKAIGIFLFLLLFGFFIYVLVKTEKNELDELAFSPVSDPQDVDALINGSKNRPIGFEYQSNSEQNSGSQ